MKLQMTRKSLNVLIAAVCLILAVALTVTLVLLFGGDAPDGPDHGTDTAQVGIYYSDVGIGEVVLTMSEGNTFTLTGPTYNKSGTYSVSDGSIMLDFIKDEDESATATVENDVIYLNYNGEALRLLKKVYRTVTFESNGGSPVNPLSVVNGKTVAAPSDPTRDGHVFIGWYVDEKFNKAFAFGSDAVTENLTLYAMWSEGSFGGSEYTVHFDANLAGVEDPEDLITSGGRLPSLPLPERKGYEFLGWWFSTSDDGDKLTSRYESSDLIKGETTLYGLWQPTNLGSKLPAPLVQIRSGEIVWDNISGARSYRISIRNSDGVTVYEEASTGASVQNPFVSLPAGEYEVRVTALANTGEKNNSEAVRYYAHKALDKVTDFEVFGSVLIFNTVENAERYYLNVKCGNPDHRHGNFDNGTSKAFNLANCIIPAEGIRVTVTATADGYASSTSREFVYKNILDEVGGLVYDEDSERVCWDEVKNAAYYMVSVLCGNDSHDHAFVYNGAKTYVDIRACDARSGGIVVKVYPVTSGYASPTPASVTVNKTALAAPSDIRLVGTRLSWSPVNGASSYEVYVGGKKYNCEDSSFDLSSVVSATDGYYCEITVRAIGDNPSAHSEAVRAEYLNLAFSPKYEGGKLIWAHVLGASSYEVRVNGGEIVSVSDGAVSADITLTRSGVNVIELRYMDGNNASDWYSTEVYAHAVIFDSLGGSAIDTVYKAVGDPIALPVPEKQSCEFVAWYNAPGGPAANAKKYDDTVFSESGTVVLYAYYDSLSYSVKYNYGTMGGGDKTADEVSYGEHYRLAVPTPTDGAVMFGGWFTAPYGEGSQLTDSRGNSLSPWLFSEEREVFAYWISGALDFTLTKVNGKDAYMVLKGSRIALVSDVTIPATYKGLPVAMISGSAFKDCTSIKVINIPTTVEVISTVDPFENCIALEAVNVYDVDGVAPSRYWSEDGVLFDNGSDVAAKPGVLLMPTAKTGSYIFPDGIIEIPELSVANSSLSKITVPSSVSLIGEGAFAGCKNLTHVVFEAADQNASLSIGARAFEGCTSLKAFELPRHLDNIALLKYRMFGGGVLTANTDHAFSGCTSLDTITVAAGNKTYKAQDGVIFSADGKTLLYCPVNKSGEFSVARGTQTIAPGAFIGCEAITRVVLPNTMTLVGEYAFYGTRLSELVFAGNAFNALTLDSYAFAKCIELTSIVTESGSRLSVIGEGAFLGCTGLSSVRIPISMTFIGKDAFKGCTALLAVEFDSASNSTVNVIEFGENAFDGCENLVSIKLPSNVSKIPGIFSGCTKLTSIEVDESNPYISSDADGVVFNKDKTELIFFPRAKGGSYTVPASVTVIASGAFADIPSEHKLNITIYNTIEYIGTKAFANSFISGITFKDHPTEPSAKELVIGDYAFAETTFKSGAVFKDITLPEHTTVIGEYAFYRAKHKTFSFGNAKITKISAHAFDGDDYLDMTYTSPAKPLVIPATVTEIGAYAFANSEIKYVTLPAGIETVSEYAFYNAQYLAKIDIPEGVTEIGPYAFSKAVRLSAVNFAENGALVKIGAYAFNNCGTHKDGMLTSITIPASISDVGAYAFGNNVYLEEVIFAEGENEMSASGLVLGSEYFYEDTDSGTVIPVRGHVFSDKTTNKNMKRVVLPARLIEIGEYSFYKAGHTSETATVEIPADCRLETIGAHAFEASTFTGAITLPASVCNTPPMTDGNLPYDRLGVGAYAFYGSNFTKIEFASGGDLPLTIGELAFGKCAYVEEVILPARLASYTSHTGEIIEPLVGGAEVFGSGDKLYNKTTEHSCDNLLYISVESKTGATYASIDGILYRTDGTAPTELVLCPKGYNKAVVLPSTLTKICDIAFFGCAKLPSVTFTAGALDAEIGERAFYGCSSLTELIISDNFVAIESGAFADCSALSAITLPAGLRSFDPTVFDGCASLANVFVGNGNNGETYSSIDGILFTGNKSTLVYCPAKYDSTVFTIPGTVKIIGANTFKGNSNLKEVILSSGVVEINDGAFSGSSITKITIPSTVSLIGENAFADCRSLTSVRFENGSLPLVIKSGAFMNAELLSSISFPANLISIADKAFYQSESGKGLKSVSFASGGTLSSIGESAFENTAISSLNLPDGMASIGSRAFYNCSSLKTAVIGEGLTLMGDQVFALCKSIESVSFPASLSTMGVNTFFGGASGACKSLKRVTFAEGSRLEAIPAGTFAYTGITEIRIPASVVSIEYYDIANRDGSSPGAFEKCTSLISLSFELGANCATIGDYAFYNCTRLENVSLATSVSTVGEYAFSGAAIEEVTIPAFCTNFGEYAFEKCIYLKSVEMSSKATALSRGMFSGCSSLSAITIPETVTSIGAFCFNNTAIGSITVPESVGDLSAEGIFYGCYALDTVIIKGAVKVIGENTFYGCVSLRDITLSDSTEVISKGAFYGCEKLTSLTLPAATREVAGAFANSGIASFALSAGNKSFAVVDGVLYSFDKTKIVAYPPSSTRSHITLPKELVEISANTFDGVTALEVVAFESGSSSSLVIGAYAFNGCTGLKSIALPDRLSVIGEYAFSGCSHLASIALPAGLREIGENAFYGCSIFEVGDFSAAISVSFDNWSTDNGGLLASAIHLYNEDGGWVKVGMEITELSSGGSKLTYDENGLVLLEVNSMLWLIKYYGTGATVSVPSGVTHVHRYAFENNTLVREVSLPHTVTSIGLSAFYGCYNLESLGMSDAVTEIGKNAFEGCSMLKSIVIPDGVAEIMDRTFFGCTGLTEVIIPSSVKKINKFAFSGCSGLSSLTLEDGIENIGENVFNGCISLEAVSIPTTVTTIGAKAFYNCSKLSAMVIPETVSSIGKEAFYGCSSLASIDVVSAVKPAGFATGWDKKSSVSNHTVNYGYNG